MKIQCPNCGTAFALADGAIGGDGRMVRCARCGTPWRAFAAEDLPATAAAEHGAGVILEGQVEVHSGPAAESRRQGPAAREAADMPVLTLPATTAGRRDHAAPNQARFVAGRAPQRPRRRSPVAALGGPLALMAAVALTLGAVVFRAPIVASVNDLAGLYALAGLDVNLRGLEFRQVTAARSIENGAPVLVVAGEVTNVSTSEVDVPAIRLALRASGAQEVYAWSVQPDDDRLSAGESVGFRSRLASPPDARDLELRFADRRPTAAAGL